MTRHLIIDLGNTAFKIAVFQNSILVEKTSIDGEINFRIHQSELLLSDIFQKYKIEKAIISSVIHEDKLKKIISFLPFPPILLDNCQLPVQINYNKTTDLGKDRIANAVALDALFPNQAVLGIDMGTCIKYDFVDQNTFQGGIISLGYKMRLQALHHFTDKLPLFEPVSAPKPAFLGESTQMCMQIGTYEAVWAETTYFIEKFQTEKKIKHFVFTGGEAKYFENRIKSMIFAVVQEDLTLIGLHKILIHNHE